MDRQSRRFARQSALSTILVILTTMLMSNVASACVVGTTGYGNGSTFLFGQTSQGGNYYYGVAGVMGTSSPPDPVDADNPQAHVNVHIGSIDDLSPGGTCCWAFTVGLSGTTATTITERFRPHLRSSQVPVAPTSSSLDRRLARGSGTRLG